MFPSFSSSHLIENSMALQGRLHNDESSSELSEEEEEQEGRLVDLRGISNRVSHHSEEKIHQCQFCDKAFKRREHCRRHERTHTGEAPFQCSHCLKRFRYSQNWKRHQESAHNDYRPFICPFCPQSFKRVEHLKRHSGTHSASLQAGRHQLGGPSVSFLNSKQPSERFNTQDSIDGDKVLKITSSNKSTKGSSKQKLNNQANV